MQLFGDIGLSEGYEDQEFSFGHAEFEATCLCEMYEAEALGNRLNSNKTIWGKQTLRTVLEAFM